MINCSKDVVKRGGGMLSNQSDNMEMLQNIKILSPTLFCLETIVVDFAL